MRLDPACVLEGGVSLQPGIRDNAPGFISVGAKSVLYRGAILNAWGGAIAVGPLVHVGPYSVIYGQGGVTIGEATLVSPHCTILSSNHKIPGLDRCIFWEGDELLPTRIGRDVWLGAGVTVLGGVTIGDGCVVGAGAVVTKDLPAGSIAMGVPAVVKGHRPAATPTPA